ncbi:MAG: DUF1003 domain-containing protein [Rudaea sp.]
MNTASLLRSVTLFDGFSDEDLFVLAPAMVLRDFAVGQTVFSQGDPAGMMYIIESGQVDIRLGVDATTEIQLRECGAGEFFGELSMFDGKPRSATARAAVASTLLELKHVDLNLFLEQRPHAAAALLRTVSGHLRETNALLSTRAATNVNEEFDRNLTWSDRVADVVAELNGSWKFILLILLITGLWCLFNSNVVSATPPDPYPYQFYNLALAILVGLQGPLIVMSQNRQSRKDRARADADYRVNVKNEVNIETLLRELRDLRAELRRGRGA